MRATTAILSLFSASLATAAVPLSPYEAVHQAEFRLASILDHKNYDQLHLAMTDDIVYDSRPLGAYGGLATGLEQTTAAVKAAFGDAFNQHQVVNALITFTDDTATAANVSTYLTWSRWDPAAPHDITKTFRIFERCDDLFVLDPKDGLWKLKYSLVTNMGPQVEGIYWNDGKGWPGMGGGKGKGKGGKGGNYNDAASGDYNEETSYNDNQETYN